MIGRRMTEVLAMMMIGDGVLAVIEPRRHARLWMDGPGWWRGMIEPFIEHPNLTRVAGAGEAALGVWLAMRQSESLS